MKQIISVFLVYLTATSSLFSQTQTDTAGLLKFANEQSKLATENMERAKKWSETTGNPLIIESAEGAIIALVGITAKGEFIYKETNNLNAARTTSTNKVWSGGQLGLELNGQNMTIGVWDGGATRTTHQEFQGRAFQMDGASSLSQHATHVSGTVAAGGVDMSARGMAWEATLHAYDWNNDDAEMAQAAAAGLLVSNHSYGTPSGWRWNTSNNGWDWYGDVNISATEDYKFGYYDFQAQNWDNIARMAPYYLIVKSAGNDRNDNHNGSHRVRINGSWTNSSDPRNPDGPYDCLPTYSNAKNILTVGAVNDLTNGWFSAAGVSMSSFSGWGPTDDGRIKPDIVGNGVSLYSSDADNDADYATLSGTSMSGPNVAGSLILLQQKYMQHFNAYMRSATLKAVAIHTADEAGNPGPDYSFGWGLLNTASAAQLIEDNSFNSIIEDNLANNATYQHSISVAGNEPIRVTLVWTDLPATPENASLDSPTPRLVNDLDLRVIDVNSGMVYEPFILDPANPSAPATTGDNFRDNVEQVFIQNPAAGNYRVEVTHKANLSTAQAFSLIISGIDGAPIANFVADSNQKCIGASVQFNTTSAGNPTGFNWTFQGGNPATSTLPNPVVRYSNTGIYDVTLTVTKAGSSPSTTTKTSYIEITAPVAVEILDTVFCFPDNTVQTIRASLPGGEWFGGNWMPFSDTAKFSPTFVGLGTFPLVYKYTSPGGCVSSDSAGILFTPYPEVKLVSFLDTLCNTDPAFLVGGGSPLGGQYLLNGLPIDSLNPSALLPNNYQLSYYFEDTYGCSGEDFKNFTIINCAGPEPIGIQENQLHSLQIFPNPVSDELLILTEKKISGVEVQDLNGRLVVSSTLIQDGVLSVNQLSAGAYILRVFTTDEVLTSKFIKR